MYNVAIVGCGRIAGKFEDLLDTQKPCTHAGAYDNSSKTRLVAVCDSDKKELVKFGERWDIPSTYTDINDMFANEKIDILSVCTPIASHYSLVMLALKSCKGLKAIWCEKPIADSIHDAEKMIEECKKNNVALAVNYCRRWDPFHIQVTADIMNGRVGTPYALDCQSHVGLMNCGTHLIDLALMYAGNDEPVSVSGSIVPDDSIDPGCCGVINFDSGKKAFIDCAWKENPQLGINVRGDKGTINAMTNQVLLQNYQVHMKNDVCHAGRKKSYESPMALALQNIIDTVSVSGTTLLSSGDTAIKSLEIAAAIYESNDSGKTIQLPTGNNDYKNRKFKCRITSMTKDGKIPGEWNK